MKPILPTTPSRSTDRKTSRTNVTSLKPAKDFFFFFLSSFPHELLLPFCPSLFLYSLFLPSFTFLFLLPAFFYIFFILIFVKIASSYLSDNLFLFLLPSFLLLFYFTLFVFFFFFFFLFSDNGGAPYDLISQFPYISSSFSIVNPRQAHPIPMA